MAVLGRLLIASAERVDVPDFLSIDSYAAGDFKYFINSLIGSDTPYILKGFDVNNPGDAINSTSISINVHNSVVWYPGSNTGSFYHGLEEGHTYAQPLVPELRSNATNYIYLTFSTFETARDTRAFWDPDIDGGSGGEFTQDINTESVLSVEINVSTSSFPENTIPICQVEVGTKITSIKDCRNLMFRLGEGGLNPNPFASHSFRNSPSSTYSRQEPSITMSTPLDPNPFQGGDKNIYSLKEWMDAVMTKLLELSGTNYWYEDAGLDLFNLFESTSATTIKSKGTWEHDSATAGLVTWSEDILLQTIYDSRDIVIRDGNKTLNNNDVLYVDINKDSDIITPITTLNWENGKNYVNGDAGDFSYLVKGDWVKKKSDKKSYYLRVEGFYASIDAGGGVATPSLAQSIKLSAPYAGTTESTYGVYTKGVYEIGDIRTVGRSENSTLEDLKGDMYWLAMRSDVIQAIDSIVTTTLSLDISEGDGSTAKCAHVGHGLIDGDRITIVGSVNYDETYIIDKVDDDTFYIETPITLDENAVSAYYATVTTKIRKNDQDFVYESDVHNFDSNQTIVIDADETSYNGSHTINVTGDTTFTIPINSNYSAASSGTATLSRVNVRSESGIVKVVRGATVNIGDLDSDNIMKFIGMTSLTQTFPEYRIPANYNNVLQGQANYNSAGIDSLTERASKLTAMMADKAQDKTIVLAPEDYRSIDNITNGTAQELTFEGGTSPVLNIYIPSSENNGIINLTGTLSLEANEVAYFEIDRNNSFSIADLSGLTISPINEVELSENVFIFAMRGDNEHVCMWDGIELIEGLNITRGEISNILVQNAYDEKIDVISGTPSTDNEIQGPVSPGTIFVIPTDSRDSDNAQSYIVGKAVVELSLNGQKLQQDVDWQEVGALGSVSSLVQIDIDLVIGDELGIRIDTAGGYVNVGGAAGEVNYGVNVGSEVEIYKTKVSTALQFRTIESGNDIVITQNTDTITIDSNAQPKLLPIETRIADYTVTADNSVILAQCTVANITFTLPPASTVEGKRYDFKKIDSTAFYMVIDGSGGDTIDGNLTVSTNVQWESLTIISNGTNWFII